MAEVPSAKPLQFPPDPTGRRKGPPPSTQTVFVEDPLNPNGIVIFRPHASHQRYTTITPNESSSSSSSSRVRPRKPTADGKTRPLPARENTVQIVNRVKGGMFLPADDDTTDKDKNANGKSNRKSRPSKPSRARMSSSRNGRAALRGDLTTSASRSSIDNANPDPYGLDEDTTVKRPHYMYQAQIKKIQAPIDMTRLNETLKLEREFWSMERNEHIKTERVTRAEGDDAEFQKWVESRAKRKQLQLAREVMARQLKEKVLKEKEEREQVQREYVEKRKKEAMEKHQRARARLAKKRADRQAAVNAAYAEVIASERSGDYARVSKALNQLYNTKGWDKQDYIKPGALDNAKDLETRLVQYYTAWYGKLKEELARKEQFMSETMERPVMIKKVFELLSEIGQEGNSAVLGDIVLKARQMHEEQLQISLKQPRANAKLRDVEAIFGACQQLLDNEAECKIRDDVTLEKCRELVRLRHEKEYQENVQELTEVLRRVEEKDNILKMVDTAELNAAVVKGEAILERLYECRADKGAPQKVTGAEFVQIVDAGRVELNRRLGLVCACAVCGVHMARRLHRSEIDRFLYFLNNECKSLKKAADKELNMKQIEHLAHLEGGSVDAMIAALKEVEAGNSDKHSFADFLQKIEEKVKGHHILSCVLRWKYLVSHARRQRRKREQQANSDAAQEDGKSDLSSSEPIVEDLFDTLATMDYLPEGYKAPHEHKGDAVATRAMELPQDGKHHCGVCGVRMEPLRREQITQILEFFNSEECGLVVDEDEGDDSEGITVHDLEHLFHQEGNMARTMANLEKLNSKGFSFAHFREIVPAINKFLTTRVILHAALKWHAILQRIRLRKLKKQKIKAEFEAKAVRCEVCGFRMLPYSKEDVMALLKYLNSDECGLFRKTKKSDLKIGSKDLIHVLHQEGSLARTIRLLKVLDAERLSFKSFHDLVPYFHHRFLTTKTVLHAVLKFKYLLDKTKRKNKMADLVSSMKVRPELMADGHVDDHDDKNGARKSRQDSIFSRLQKNNLIGRDSFSQFGKHQLTDSDESQSDYATSDDESHVQERVHHDRKQHVCKVCDVKMDRMSQHDVIRILEWLNGDDCVLFEGNEEEQLKINRADLNHLFHQEGSVDRIISHLTTMGEQGQRYKSFHDLVPAINRQFTAALVLSAVVKFKYLLARAKKRKGVLPQRRRTRQDSIFTRLKQQGFVNAQGQRVSGAWIDESSDISSSDSEEMDNEDGKDEDVITPLMSPSFQSHQPPALDLLLTHTPSGDGELALQPTPSGADDHSGSFVRTKVMRATMSPGEMTRGSLAELSLNRRPQSSQSQSRTPMLRSGHSRSRSRFLAGMKLHTCKRCGVRCPKMNAGDVEQLVEYLNSPDCNLFSTNVAEDLRISKKDLYHLWHQEGTIERTLDHLRALSASDRVFQSFHDLVPAIHLHFTTSVVMTAVIRWKYLWKKGKARRQEADALSRHSFVATPSGGRRKRAASIYTRMKSSGYITGNGVQKLGAYIDDADSLPVLDDELYYCKLCGSPMRMVVDDEIGQIIAFLNSSECQIFSESNPDALMIKRQDLDHLFHQRGSLEKTLERLRALNADGVKCAQFADVVPAMTSFNAAGTVVRAALRFRRNTRRARGESMINGIPVSQAVLCGVCDFPMRELTKLETTAMVDYLNSPMCNLFLGSEDEELVILKKDLQHLFHQEGDLQRTLTNLRKMSDAGLRFKNFDDVVPATFRYVTAGVCMNAVVKFKYLLRRAHRRRGLALSREDVERKSVFASALKLGYINDGKRMRLEAKSRPSIVGRQGSLLISPSSRQSDMFGATKRSASPSAKTPSPTKPYACKVCGLNMEKLKPETVAALLDFLNGDECMLFMHDDDIKITQKDIDHLYHQENSLERTLAHLREINKRGITYDSFSELVPAIHRMFLSTKVVLHAVYKFKYLLMRVRRKQAAAQGGEAVREFKRMMRAPSINTRLKTQGLLLPEKSPDEKKSFFSRSFTEPSMASLAEEPEDDDGVSIM